MDKLDITLVTVTSVLFRMLKVSATDFGSDIYHGVVVSLASGNVKMTRTWSGARTFGSSLGTRKRKPDLS